MAIALYNGRLSEFQEIGDIISVSGWYKVESINDEKGGIMNGIKLLKEVKKGGSLADTEAIILGPYEEREAFKIRRELTAAIEKLGART